jgi:hypothetical protein
MHACRLRLATVILSAIVFSLGLAGCGEEGSSTVSYAGLKDEYRGLACPRGNVALTLSDDGSFLIVLRPPGDSPSSCVSDDEPEADTSVQSLEGTWQYVGRELTLTSEDREIVFAPDTVSVWMREEFHDIAGLRWIRSRGKTFADSCDLVCAREVHEVLHPTEGGGGQQAGW